MLVFFGSRHMARECVCVCVTWKETLASTKLKMAIMMKYQQTLIQQPFSVDKESDQHGESDIQLVCKCNWSQFSVFYHRILAGWTHSRADPAGVSACFQSVFCSHSLQIKTVRRPKYGNRKKMCPENTRHVTHADSEMKLLTQLWHYMRNKSMRDCLMLIDI